jgi:YbbR domain-containing protein
MGKWLSSIEAPRNIGVLLLAAILSVSVWVLANVEQNPEITGVFSSPIPVEVAGLPDGMVIYGQGPGSVTVKIRAPQANWGRLRVANFRAYIDVSSGSPGLQELDVRVECTDGRVGVLEADPVRVSVRLEPVRERAIPVRIRAVDDAPVGYAMLPPKSTPSHVTITGPAPLADAVSEAYVEVRIDGAKTGFVKSYRAQLRDAQGKEVKDLAATPTSVDVEMFIEQLRNYKTISIKAVITGTLAPGYWISGIVVQPTAVTFGGDPQVLDSFGYVETTPVDITGAVTEVLKSVSIFTPPGTALDKKQDVFVKVSIEQLRSYKTVPVRAVITGAVASGYWISGIAVQPATAAFGGDPKVIDALGYAETAPVNVTGAVTEVVRTVGVLTPPGTAPEKRQDALVRVSVEPMPGGGILRRAITWRNLTRGITATLSISTVDIRVDGVLLDLRNLRPTDLAPSVDLAGLLTGTYTLPVTITGVPTGTKVISVTPEKVGVGIR